jgi:ubiquinone/menaquinone biosynthesis C-methylase UbiE
MDGCFWDAFFRSRKSHHFLAAMRAYKRDIYENVFRKAFAEPPAGKVIWVTDSYDQSYGLDIYAKLRKRNAIIDSDISKLCMSRVKEQRMVTSDAASAPFRNDSIDVIISPSTMDHCAKEELDKFLSEAERVMKAGGVAVVLVHNRENIFMRFGILQVLEKIPYFTYSRKEVNAIVRKHAKLELSDVFYAMNMPFPLLSTSLVNLLDRMKLLKGMIGWIVKAYLRMSSRVSRIPYMAELMCIVLKKKA